MAMKRPDDPREEWRFSPPEPLDTLLKEAESTLAEAESKRPPANWPPVPMSRPRDTSLGSALRYGANQLTDNIGLSLKHQGLVGAGEFVTGLIDPEPGNYLTAAEEFQNKYGDGYNWSALGRGLVEQAPNFVVSNGAKFVPGAGSALAYGHGYMQAYGPILEARAKANGGLITDADLKYAHSAAIALGAIDAVGFGGLAKPAAAIGRTVAGAASKAGGELAERVAQTAVGKAAGEAVDALAHAAPVGRMVTAVVRPVAEIVESLARSKPVGDALVGGLESGTKSIVEQAGGSAGTRDGLNIDPATVTREVITGAGLEAGKGLMKPVRDLSARHLTPEHEQLLGGAAAVIAVNKALETLQAANSPAVEQPDDPSKEMALRALLLQAGQDALSGTQRPPIALHGSVWGGNEPDQPPPMTRRQLYDLLIKE